MNPLPTLDEIRAKCGYLIQSNLALQLIYWELLDEGGNYFEGGHAPDQAAAELAIRKAFHELQECDTVIVDRAVASRARTIAQASHMDPRQRHAIVEKLIAVLRTEFPEGTSSPDLLVQAIASIRTWCAENGPQYQELASAATRIYREEGYLPERAEGRGPRAKG